MKLNDEKKEKRIKNLMKLDLKKQFKELLYDRNDTIEPNNIFTKSNKNLANNINEKLKYMSPIQNSVKKQRNDDKFFSVKAKPKISQRNINNQITDSPKLFDYSEKAKFKTKIYRVVGKKVNNFGKIFEEKNNSLNELIQNFKTKILEVHKKFKILSNSGNKNSESSVKIKSNSYKFINFNEIYIFERKIVEFMEKRNIFFIKIIKSIDSIFSEDYNINFDTLNDFYNELNTEANNLKQENYLVKSEKNYNTLTLNDNESFENNNKTKNKNMIDKINDYNYKIFETLESPLSHREPINYVNTEGDVKEKEHHKFLLPLLKKENFNKDQLNTKSFRNVSKPHELTSLNNESIKHYNIFNSKRRSVMGEIGRNNNNLLNSLTNSKDKKKITLKYKNENHNLKDDENETIKKNKHHHSKDREPTKKEIKENKNHNHDLKIRERDLTQKDEESKLKEIIKFKRSSVARLTVRDYGSISNVDNYILNYSPVKKNKSKNKNEHEHEHEHVNDHEQEERISQINEKENENDNDNDNNNDSVDNSRIINKNNLNLKLEFESDEDEPKDIKDSRDNYKDIFSNDSKKEKMLLIDTNNKIINGDDNDNDIINNENNIDNENNNYNDKDNDNDNDNDIINNKIEQSFHGTQKNLELNSDEDKKSIYNKLDSSNEKLFNHKKQENDSSSESIDNKDPLDDINYLKKLREEENKLIKKDYLEDERKEYENDNDNDNDNEDKNENEKIDTVEKKNKFSRRKKRYKTANKQNFLF